MENQELPESYDSSLEGTSTIVGADSTGLQPASPPPRPAFTLGHFGLGKPLLTGGVILLVVILALIFSLHHKTTKTQSTKTIVVNTQNLDSGALNKLTSQLDGDGQVRQQLTITPNTLFKNDVAIQGNTTVQKDLTVEGNFSTKGASNLIGPVSTGSALNVGGSLTVRTSASIGGNLSVSGQITAASLSVGSITLSTVNLSGNLSLSGHIVPTGGRPAITPSVSAAGGSAIIDGNDTAGTVTITTGNGAPLAGEMVIITFHAPFNLTPRVQLTPVNGNAASLQYYATQSPTFFTIRAANIPAASTVYYFNYFVTD